MGPIKAIKSSTKREIPSNPAYEPLLTCKRAKGKGKAKVKQPQKLQAKDKVKAKANVKYRQK